MNGNQILILFLGGLAFFLYGLTLVQSGLKKVGSRRLRALVISVTDSRWAGFLAGGGISVLLQSSNAAVIMFMGLANAGALALGRAVPLLLGADLGTTVTVQLLSFHLSNYALLVFALGVFIRIFAQRDELRDWGKALIGIGLLFYGMHIMAEAGAPLRDSPQAQALAGFFAHYPIYGVIFGALLTALLQHSAATLGLIMSLGQSGIIDLAGALPLVLGANVGTCVLPLLASLPARNEGKRIALLHLLIKAAAGLLALPLLAPWAKLSVWSGPTFAHQVANAHFFFNLALTLAVLPLCGVVARLGERLIAGAAPPERPFGPRFLDPRALDTPSLALGNAQREILRMAELVQEMLEQAHRAYGHPAMVAAIRQLDDKVDILYEEIKFYLARLSADGLSEGDARHYLDLFDAIGHLEEAGDVLSKNVCSLLEKKRSEQLFFSDQGLAEIREFHQEVLDNFKQAMAAFAAGDRQLAAALLRKKQEIWEREKALRQAHLGRLHQGMRESQESSAVHLEILGHLRHFNSVITRVVRPLASHEER
jgi:phosphate:Na+ symporter